MSVIKRATVVALIATASLLPMAGPALANEAAAPTVAASTSVQYDTLRQAGKTVKPLVRWRWWGVEIRLTKAQTQFVAHAAGGAVLLIPGVNAAAAYVIGLAFQGSAIYAAERKLCMGMDLNWANIAGLMPNMPSALRPRPFTYDC